MLSVPLSFFILYAKPKLCILCTFVLYFAVSQQKSRCTLCAKPCTQVLIAEVVFPIHLYCYLADEYCRRLEKYCLRLEKYCRRLEKYCRRLEKYCRRLKKYERRFPVRTPGWIVCKAMRSKCGVFLKVYYQ